MSEIFVHRHRKNGKNVTLFRKVCEDCHSEYIQQLGAPDVHHCQPSMTADEIYAAKSDEFEEA